MEDDTKFLCRLLFACGCLLVLVYLISEESCIKKCGHLSHEGFCEKFNAYANAPCVCPGTPSEEN